MKKICITEESGILREAIDSKKITLHKAQRDTFDNKVNSIDLFKLFFAVCIVLIHTELLKVFPDKINWYVTHMVFRVAVPYFFVASGYFFGLKIRFAKNKEQRLGYAYKYIQRNVRPLIFWGICGLLISILKIYKEKSLLYLIAYSVQRIFFYPLGAMWFLLASMIGVYCICKLWDRKWLLVVIAILGYCFALICNTYYFTINNTIIQKVVNIYMKLFVSARNGLFIGIIYIGIGVGLACNNKVNNISIHKVILSFIVCCIILYIEVSYTYEKKTLDDSSLFIIMPMLAGAMLMLTKRIIMTYSMNLSKKIRQVSGYLFFIHPFYIRFNGLLDNEVYRNKIVLSITAILFCLIIWFLTRNSKNKFIRSVLP